MANRCNQVMYDFTKILFRKMEAVRLVVLFDTFSFLSERERTLLKLIYCDGLPMKCVAFKLKISKRMERNRPVSAEPLWDWASPERSVY